jgi:muconate cycloisomerase
MRISAVEWFEVNQFVYPDMVDSPQYRTPASAWDQIPKFLLRLNTDEGLSGIGETPRGAKKQQVEAAARQLLGQDPLALNLKQLPCSELGGLVYRGFETAVFDLVGHARGMRVCELLGGAFRDQVESSFWAGRQTVEDSVETAQEAWVRGYGCIKIKDRKDIPLVERVAQMHAQAPDLRFIIDPMQAYDDVEEVIELSRRLEPYPVICIEDPLPKARLADYARLRQEGPVPLALHASSPGQVLEAIRADAVDYFNCSPGSMVRFVQMAELAEIAGKPCWQGSGVDLGVLDLAYIHSCAAARNCTVPSDILSHLLHVEDFVTEMPARRQDRVTVPEGPGLGGELDMAAVEEFLVSKGRID